MKFRATLLVAGGLALAAAGTQISTAAEALASNAAATHYTSAYSMDFTGATAPSYTGPADLGFWQCSGTRVNNKNTVRDNFTCTTTATDVTATFTQSIPWPCGCSGWASDLDGQVATSYEIDISAGTVSGWAIYN